jgi:hypothetical protein
VSIKKNREELMGFTFLNEGAGGAWIVDAQQGNRYVNKRSQWSGNGTPYFY